MKKVVLLAALFTAFACTSEPETEAPNPQEFVFKTSKILSDFDPPNQDIIHLQELGFSGSSGVVLEKTDHVFDETYITYLMEGDIEIRQDKLLPMVEEIRSKNTDRQYRTWNLVESLPRTLHIIAINMYNPSLQTGLTRAVQNYNQVHGLDLHFTLEFRNVQGIPAILAAIEDSDILAKQIGGPAGGSAGFPSGGDPYSEVNVSGATANFGLDVVEHVFTHEIAHAIGLRHTDYFDRSISCSTGGNEGQANIGAVHIPGTPSTTNVDLESVFLSCFNGTETGEFSLFDQKALQNLYCNIQCAATLGD